MNMPSEEVGEKIKTAFVKLLQEKPYKRITFKELASESSMSRQNLYYYYKSKENVLEDIIEDFFERIYETIMVVGIKKLGSSDNQELGKELIQAIVEALKENEDVARCFFSKDVNIVFINKMVAFLKRMLGSMIRAKGITVNDPKYIHYLALQMAGSSYLPIREWLIVDTDFPVERIVELGHPMIEQIIKSLENN
jgi:AcrR family transcriptional regulator